MSAAASSRSRGGRESDNRSSLDSENARRRLRARLVTLAAVLVLLPALAQTIYLVPDSAAHLAWARSLGWDRDVDFANEYARLGSIEREGSIRFAAETPLGRAGNPFGMGSAFFWAPWLALGALGAAIAAATGAAVATDGFGTTLLQAAALGSWTAALVAFALLAWTLRDLARLSDAAERRPIDIALTAAFLGTPVLYYVLQLPTYAHAASAAAAALVLTLGHVWKDRWTDRRALALGAGVGFAALIRVQDIVFAALPIGLAWAHGGLGNAGGARLRRLGLFGLGLAVAFAPQLVAWTRLYGSPLVLPQGEGFLRFTGKALAGVLFSARHGLFVWTPATLLAVAGLVLLARQPATRALGIAALTVFAAEWLVNALPVDWWAGWSFGARRFSSCVPLFALGLWAVCRTGRGVRIAVLVATGAALVQWLRVATRSLNAEADPGWDALWGGGFFGFLPQLPSALFDLVRSPWLEVQVIRRPQSVAPDFHVDPASLAYGLWLVWAGIILFVARRVLLYVERSARRLPGSRSPRTTSA